MAIVTRFIDTASTSGGDGTTQSHTGDNRAYPSMNSWEAGEDTDLVTDGDSHVVNCAGSTNDTTAVDIFGWVTGVSNDITIQGDETAPDSDGRGFGNSFNTSFYVFDSNVVQTRLMFVREDFVTIRTIQFVQSANDSGSRIIETFDQTASNKIVIEKCRFKKTGTSDQGRPIRCLDDDTLLDVLVCTFEWRQDTGDDCISCANLQGLNCYNCTIEGGNAGIDLASGITDGTFIIRNNAIFNMLDAGQDIKDETGGGATVTIENNATDDEGTADGNVDISSGSVEADEWAFAVKDYTNGDYTIIDDDSVLVDAGTVTGAPATDINDVAYGSQDIGAFAHVQSIAPVVRSISAIVKQTTGSQPLILTPPAGIVDGDLLIALVVQNAGTLGWSSSGWTEIDETDKRGIVAGIYFKKAASESGNYTFNNNTGTTNRKIGRILCIKTGTWKDTGTLSEAINVGPTETDTSGSTATCPSETTTVDLCRVIRFVAADGREMAGGTPPTDQHDVWNADSDTSGAQCSFGGGHRIQLTLGATGTVSWTLAAAEGHIQWTICIEPAAAVGGATIKHTQSFRSGYIKWLTIPN